MTQDEREALGLSFFSDRPAPDSLRGSIPRSDGGVMPFANYSSFGYFADLPGGLSQTILPQVGGSLNALTGLDPFGQHLEQESGAPVDLPHRFLQAGIALAGAYVPGVGKVQQVAAADSIGEGLKKQLPLTNASALDADLYENYLRNLSQMQSIQIPVEGANLPSSSAPSTSVFGPGSSSSSSSSSSPSSPPSVFGPEPAAGVSLPWAP